MRCNLHLTNITLRNPMSLRHALACATLLICPCFVFADAKRGTLVHEETIRASPSADAARLGEASRGHELIILDTTRYWLHVHAILRDARKYKGLTDADAETHTISRWLPPKRV